MQNVDQLALHDHQGDDEGRVGTTPPFEPAYGMLMAATSVTLEKCSVVTEIAVQKLRPHCLSGICAGPRDQTPTRT